MRTVTMYANKDFLNDIKDNDVSGLHTIKCSDYKTKVVFEIESTKTFTESEMREAVNRLLIGKTQDTDTFINELFSEPVAPSKMKKKARVEEDDDWN